MISTLKGLRLFWLFIVSLLTVSCSTDKFPISARESFVKVERHITFFVCNKKTDKCKKNKDVEYRGYGSGSIISINSLGAFILTAEHVCRDLEDEEELLDFIGSDLIKIKKKEYVKSDIRNKVISFEGQVGAADIINQDEELDTCILFAEGFRKKPLKRHYRPLEIGKLYYNMAAPLGTFTPGTVPLLEGRYIGSRSSLVAAFTIPCAPGSSGSPIFDEKRRLVGMIHSMVVGFNEVCYSANLARLNKFIDESISDYHDKWHRNMLQLTRPKTN